MDEETFNRLMDRTVEQFADFQEEEKQRKIAREARRARHEKYLQLLEQRLLDARATPSVGTGVVVDPDGGPPPQAKDTPPPRDNKRTTANDKLKFAVKLLFSLDEKQELTVAAIRNLSMVQEFQKEQNITDDRLKRILNQASPDYAKGKPGQHDNWNNSGEAYLRVPLPNAD